MSAHDWRVRERNRFEAVNSLTTEELEAAEKRFMEYFGPRPTTDSGMNLAGDFWDEARKGWLTCKGAEKIS